MGTVCGLVCVACLVKRHSTDMMATGYGVNCCPGQI